MVDKIKSDAQKSEVQAISLFQLDLTEVTSSTSTFILYITPSSSHAGITDQNITFNGQAYTPYPIEIDGFKSETEGVVPAPRFTIGNVNSIITPLLNQYNDILNTKLTRIETLRKYLDGQPGADPSATYGKQVWFFERKVAHDKNIVSWELRTPVPLETTPLPKRQVTNFCPLTYRQYNSGTSQFVQGKCTFTGSTYFDKNGNAVSDPLLDKCGKRVSDCALRFGEDKELPLHGYPLVRRV